MDWLWGDDEELEEEEEFHSPFPEGFCRFCGAPRDDYYECSSCGEG